MRPSEAASLMLRSRAEAEYIQQVSTSCVSIQEIWMQSQGTKRGPLLVVSGMTWRRDCSTSWNIESVVSMDIRTFLSMSEHALNPLTSDSSPLLNGERRTRTENEIP